MRVGIIGLGMAAAPHAMSLIDLKDRVEVAGAFSPSSERRAAFAGRFGFPVADSAEVLFDDPSIEALVVLTPPNTHLDLVRRAAKSGKHVLLEKPLEISFDRSRELVEEMEKASLKLGVVLQQRFRRSIREVAARIAQGRLGEVVSVSVRLNNWRPQSYYNQPGRGTKARDGGGVLLTQAIHTLDQMIALAGLPAEVSAFATTSKAHRMETEDLVHAVMRFDTGALGAISATTAAYPGFPDAIEIIGTLGTARLDSSGAVVSWLHRTEEHLSDGTEGNGAGADPMAFSHDNHRTVHEDFYAAIRDEREPLASGREALKVHRLIDTILRAAETGQRERV